MSPKKRMQLIKDIAIFLQAEYNTREINLLLGGYDISDFQNSVSSKKNYVIELLSKVDSSRIEIIANDVLDDYDSLIEENESFMFNSNSAQRKIFISHSSSNRNLVEKIIDLMEAFGVPSNKIFCSSFEGYGIGLGENFLERLKSELDKDVLVIFILSREFYKSPICLCEMGATWVKTNQHIPIVVSPLSFDDIKGVIPMSQGMRIDDEIKYNSFKKKIKNFLQLEEINQSIWERKRKKLVNEIKVLVKDSNLISNSKEKSKDLEDKALQSDAEEDSFYDSSEEIIKKKSKKEWPEDFGMQLHYIETQKSAVQKLKKNKPEDLTEDEFMIIRRRARREWPEDFEMQLHIEDNEIESFRKLR